MMDTIKSYGLQELAAFVAVVDAGGFSAAARVLGVNKAAVSKQVARLETGLKVQLLQRSTRRLSMTEAGQEAYWHASRMLEEADLLESAIAGQQKKPAGLLRVSTSTVLSNLHIAGLMPEFMARHPELRVAFELNDRYVDLTEERIDVALRLSPPPQLQTAVARPLTPLRYALVAAPAYLARCGAPANPEQLAEHRCLTYRASGDALRWEFLHQGKSVAVKVASALAANSSESLRAAMLGGAGIAVLPTFCIGLDLQSGAAQRLLPDYEPAGLFGSHLYAVYLKHRYLTPKVRVFIDFLLEKIGEPAYWDQL